MPVTRSVLALAAVLAAPLALLGGAKATAQAPEATAQAPEPPASWSVEDCKACHDTATGPAFAHTKHAQGGQSCASCHQDVGEHARAQAEGRTDGPVPSVKKLTAAKVNETCLTCHEKDGQANWHSSAHDRRDVACTSCHSVHAAKSAKALLVARTDSETCFGCHKTERAKSLRTSHHPVREGKMGCASCHNPHDGARPKLLKADSTNELCYQCHTEKRGPFLFEHAPVREDCISCHEPHGTNHKRLLAQKVPNLCWDCHLTGSGHFGTGDNLSTEVATRVALPGSPSGFPTANSRFVEKSCKNCHANIHGSNSPSGAYFVR